MYDEADKEEYRDYDFLYLDADNNKDNKKK